MSRRQQQEMTPVPCFGCGTNSVEVPAIEAPRRKPLCPRCKAESLARVGGGRFVANPDPSTEQLRREYRAAQRQWRVARGIDAETVASATQGVEIGDMTGAEVLKQIEAERRQARR